MTTVNDLVAELGKFDGNSTVNGAESLTVAVTTNSPVIAPVEAPTDTPA